MVPQRNGERGGVFRLSLDHFLYLGCALLGLAVMIIGYGYRTPNVGLVGPAAVPLLVGGLLVLLAIMPLAAELLAGTRQGRQEAEEAPLSRSAIFRMAALLVICIFFALGFEFLGFWLTASLSIFAAILVLGGRLVAAAVMALILPAFLWAGFVGLLGLTLPVGDLFYSLLYS